LIKNLKLKIKSSRGGFTLIEVMVVMAIIGILASTAIVNIGKNDDRDVRAEKDRLSSFVREVQNKALTGDKTGVATDNKVCGYGIKLDNGNFVSYYLFSDPDPMATTTKAEDVNCASDWTDDDLVSPARLDTFHLSQGISLSILPDASCEAFFHVPDGKMETIGSSTVICDPFEIELKKDSVTDDITIGESGNIF
jgi:prepilin-type N-terminal cleavage/methylation domain-containing protein